MRHRTRLAALFAAALAAGVAAQGASAALFFVFSPTSAKPGDRVSLRTPGTPSHFDVRQRGARPPQRPIRLFLVSNAIAAHVSSPHDRRLHPIGSIVLDKNGHGVARFILPRLTPGRYAVAGICRQCARYSFGRTFFVLRVDEDITPKWRPLMLLRVRAP
jgi:hypothetical protein